MKAICIIPGKGLQLQEAPQPEKAAPQHLLIKMIASAINPGDKAFINRPLPPYLGDDIPFTKHTRELTAKNISFRPFANIRTQTVTDPQNLEQALASISEALAVDDEAGGKAILDPYLP